MEFEERITVNTTATGAATMMTIAATTTIAEIEMATTIGGAESPGLTNH